MDRDLPPEPISLDRLLQWIRDDLRGIMGKFNKMELSWSPDGNLDTLKFYEKGNLLVTMTFTWDAGGNLTSIERA